MLFDGEKITWEKKVQREPQISDEEINKKYLAGEVRIVTEQARYPLDTIMGMIDSGKYELMPSFQRRHRWSTVKKSRLIESFIMNVPIPPIFLYENEYSHYEVMDGLQRMTTIYEFYQDKFALKGLEQWAELNGKYGEIKESEIIANLNSCLNQNENEYQLNLNAFRQHSSNFRTNSIRDFFKTVGIDNIDQIIAKDPDLTTFIQSSIGEADITPELPVSKYFEIIEDLVERRNVVAHGSNVDDLLSLDILDGYAEYVFLLMRAIYNSLLQEYYSVMITAGIAKNMGQAIQVYDNRIVCLNSANTLIKVGQVLIGENNKGHLHWGRIESIQINRDNVDEVPSEKAENVGMAVSFYAKSTYTYYLYSNNCP